MPYDPFRGNALTTAASTTEMQVSGQSLEEPTVNYFKYGITSAGVSGVVGVLNTITSLLNTFGTDLDQIDEGESIDALLGKDAGNFYDRHKVGVDLGGFVASSLVVGLGAIKAVRQAQGLGKLNANLEAATGLRNADIVLNSVQVERAKVAALSNPISFSLNNRAYYGAVGLGFRQAAIENLVFTAATIATTNQNALINPEKLSYFEAGWSQTKEALPFLVLGTALQGGIDAIRIRGAVKKVYQANEAETIKQTITRIDNFDVLPAGDRLSLGLASKVALLADPKFGEFLSSGNVFKATRAGKGLAQLDTLINSALSEINSTGLDSAKLLESIMKSPLDKLDQNALKVVTDNLAGVTRIGRIELSVNDDLYGFYSKTNAPYLIASGRNAQSLVATQQEQLGQLLGIRAETLSLELDELLDKLMLDMQGAAGAMLNNSEQVAEGIKFANTFSAMRKQFADAFILPKLITGGKALTGVMLLNDDAVKRSYEFIQTFKNESKFTNMLNFTFDEYRDLVFLHEMGHWKSNGSAMLETVINSARRSNGVLLDELEQFSRAVLVGHWAAVDDYIKTYMEKKGITDFAQARADFYKNQSAVDAAYVTKPVELLAQTHAYMLHPKYMELASKLAPRTTKLFNKFGAFAKPFSPTVAYKNLRTGESRTSVLPLPQDLGKVGYKNGIVDLLVNGKKQKSVVYDTDLFNPAKLAEKLLPKFDIEASGSMEQPYMQAAMQFAAEGLQDANKYLDKLTMSYVFNAFDLPKLENLLVAHYKGTLKDSQAPIRLMVDGKPYSSFNMSELAGYVMELKTELRLRLAQEFALNEEMIAHSLNVSRDFAMGARSLDYTADLILGMTRKYDEPEHVQLTFTKIYGKELKDSARGEASIAYRQEVFGELSRRTAAELLGEAVTKLPDIPMEALMSITATATEASLVTSRRAEVGLLGIREQATLVNKIITQETARISQEIEDDFAYYYQAINKPSNYAERAELALVTNLAYQDWYSIATAGKTKFLMLKKDKDVLDDMLNFLLAKQTLAETNELPKDLFKTMNAYNKEAAKFDPMIASFDAQVKQGIAPDILTAYAKSVNAKQLSANVGAFFERQIQRNNAYTTNMMKAAEAKGQTLIMHKGVIYPPRRNLTKTPYIAFVSPKSGSPLADADPHKYMIFAKTAEELDIKIAEAKSAYGDSYSIVTKAESAEYFKLRGEYEKGKVFDEYQFDPSLFRRGRTSELQPNLDIEASEVLDRFRDMEQTRLRHTMALGVELFYPEITSALRNADEAFAVGQKSVVGKNTAPDTIFKRTLNQLTNMENRDTVVGEAWKKFNGYVGEKGGLVVDAIVSRLGVIPSARLTQADFDAMNAKLAEAGFKPPFQDLFKAIAASPDASKNRTLEALVRTMNNLAGTFMIRLDVANSIVTLLSTPILGLPVINEAIRNSKQVRDLTRVQNPVTKVYEPSAAKLFMNASRNFWTDDGKKFLAELRNRGIITDFLKDYHEAQDFSSLTGRHLLTAVNDKVTKLSDFGSKWSAHLFAEDFSKFVIADSVRQVAKLRGLSDSEMFVLAANAVDTVHGIYKSGSRVKLFNGVVGQALGMYQTYFFNFMQNAAKWIADGNKKQVMLLAGLQATTYGAASLPGFHYFNNLVAETNRGNLDLFEATGAADESATISKWFMYGLGSNAFPIPSDFFSRGDMVIRNALVVPTNPLDFPSVAILGKFLSRAYDTGKELAVGDSDKVNALWFGLAHNGLSRPLQGLGTTMLGAVTTNKGQVLLQNTNYENYDVANEINLGAIASRIIGTRSLDEAIRLDSYYRQLAYKAADKEDVANLSKSIRLAFMNGQEVSSEQWDKFALKYERIGGKPEEFNSLMTRIMGGMAESKVEKLREKLEEDSPLQRLQDRMLEGRRLQQDDWNSLQDMQVGQIGEVFK